jgi:hypothetical protein
MATVYTSKFSTKRTLLLDLILNIPLRTLPPRFTLSRILNVDETPIPFEYLDLKTYNIRGATTVSVRTDRSRWDKRQATLILYIFADGVPRIKPKLIFKGKPTEGGQIKRQEAHLYRLGHG